MKRYTFSELLQLLEQSGAAYDDGRRKMTKRAERFWDEICTTAAGHPDPVMRARLIGVIYNADVCPVKKRAALEKLLETESHEIPLRSLRFALRFSLDL